MGAKLKLGDNAPDFQFDTPWEGEKSFVEAAGGKPAVLVFLRYLGCPICQLDMANLKREIDLIDQKGAMLCYPAKLSFHRSFSYEERRLAVYHHM